MKFDKKKHKKKTVLSLFKIVFPTKRVTGKKFIFKYLQLNTKQLREQMPKLKISEEHFRFALEASEVGVWDWDIRTNSVIYSSQSIKILELKLSETMNSSGHWSEKIHPDDLEKYHTVIQKHFDNNTSFYENYYRIQTCDGKYKWIFDKGKVVERYADGSPLKVIGSHADISSQKQKELELNNKIEVYRKQNNRLLNFSYIVSHNLNTHIGNIKLLLDVNDLKEYKSNHDTLVDLRNVSNDLNETISNLSQIIHIDNKVDILIKPLQINKYLNKVLSLISAYSYEQKAIIVNNIPDKTMVNFNPAYLESVLLNFCTNAIRYAHPSRFPIIKFDFFIENEKKMLTIQDNGQGIDLEKYGDLLFGMYKTFHRHKEAQGIGLYIAKKQIEAMKGQISVTSKVGEGSTFKIIFND